MSKSMRVVAVDYGTGVITIADGTEWAGTLTESVELTLANVADAEGYFVGDEFVSDDGKTWRRVVS